jgi:DNA polymerase-3 subunit gamma/tau
MTYTALARKYRPARFRDLVSQGHVATGLAGAVAKNRVAHGYLLTGPRGTGKTTAARILAMALNCERRTPDSGEGEPCGECDSCRRTWSGAANLDVVEIDAASNRGVDDARQLRERAMYAASGPDRYKVYIVDEAHMLTREAWNALLKILEEPPPRVVFVFATTEPQKIANTTTAVLSRLQRFDFRRIGPAAIAARLTEVAQAESISIDDNALALIARVANGAMRDALSILDQVVVFGDGAVTASGVREALGLIDDEMYAELLRIVAERRSADVFPFVSRLVELGADLGEFVNGIGEVLRAILIRLAGGEPEGLTEELRQAVDQVVGEFSDGDLLRMLRLLQEAETSIRRSPNARLYVETLLLQWALLDRTVEIADVLAAIKGRGASGSAGRDPRPDPPASPQSTTRTGGRRVSAREAAPPPPPSAAGPGATPSPGTPAGGPTHGWLVSQWESFLDHVGKKNPMVKEMLSHARPTALKDGEVRLEVEGDMSLEGLNRNKNVVRDALSTLLGVQAQVTFASASAEPPTPVPEPKRQTPEGDRDARMRTYRAQDPTLDAVAEALDLELME